jgi:hypothetical protein
VGGLVGRYLIFIYLLHFIFKNKVTFKNKKVVCPNFCLILLLKYRLMTSKKIINQVEHVQINLFSMTKW